MKALVLTLLLLCSCISVNVARVGRHERLITASGGAMAPKFRLFQRIKHKAEGLDPPCHTLNFTTLEDKFAEAICLRKP